jgi:hypothetical protein
MNIRYVSGKAVLEIGWIDFAAAHNDWLHDVLQEAEGKGVQSGRLRLILLRGCWSVPVSP